MPTDLHCIVMEPPPLYVQVHEDCKNLCGGQTAPGAITQANNP